MKLKRTPILFAALLVLSLPLHAQISGASMVLKSGGEDLPAFIAAPNDAIRKPGIVVIQEWWGLNNFVRGKAEYFARQGYVAIAPDLYRGQVTDNPDVAHQLMRGLPEDRAIRDLKTAVEFLRGRADVNPKKLGAVGWCMGGGYSLSLALAEPELAGAVIYYGRLLTDDAAIKSLRPALLGHFAGRDQGILVASVKEFERKAKAFGKRVDFKIYPEGDHTFASSNDPQVYRAADAKDADARTDAFFKRVLKGIVQPKKAPKAAPKT